MATVRTRTGLNTEDVNVYLNDNTSGDIDPVDHRTSNEDHAISTTNFLDDNFSINGDGSHEYTADPTGAWDGTAQHDLKFIPKKWLDDTLSTFPTSLENGLNVLGGVGRLGGDLTQNTIIDLRDTVNVADRNLEVEYGAGNIKLFQLNGDGSFTLGSGASSSNINQVVIGQNAQTTSSGGVAIGNNSQVKGTDGVTIGSGSGTSTGTVGTNNIFIGKSVGIGGGNIANNCIAIGTSSVVGAQNGSIALGIFASSTGFASFAVGLSAVASQQNAICIGRDSTSTNINSITLGTNADATNNASIAIGQGSQSTNSTTVAIGNNANSSGSGGISMGNGARASSLGSISIGNTSGSTSGTFNNYAINIGANNDGTADCGLESIALGKLNETTAGRTVSIGNDNLSSASNAVSFGSRIISSGSGSMTFGYGIGGGNELTNSISDSIAFGWNSTTPNFLYSKLGQFLVKSLPVFDTDILAGGGGVATDEIYKTSTGELRIKL